MQRTVIAAVLMVPSFAFAQADAEGSINAETSIEAEAPDTGVEETAESAAENVGDATQSVAETTSDAAQSAAETAGDAVDATKEAASDAAESIGDATQNTVDTAQELGSEAMDMGSDVAADIEAEVDAATDNEDVVVAEAGGHIGLSADSEEVQATAEMMSATGTKLDTLVGSRVFSVDAEGEADAATEVNATMTYDGVGDAWDRVGSVDKVLVTEAGDMIGVVAEVGGFLGIGDRMVVLTMDNAALVQDGDEFVLVTGHSSAELEAQPEYGDLLIGE